MTKFDDVVATSEYLNRPRRSLQEALVERAIRNIRQTFPRAQIKRVWVNGEQLFGKESEQ